MTNPNDTDVRSPDRGEELRAALDDAKKAFDRGYLIACANIMHLHGEDTIARNTLEQLGATKAEMEAMGFDDYDLKPLRALFREMARLRAVDRRIDPARAALARDAS